MTKPFHAIQKIATRAYQIDFTNDRSFRAEQPVRNGIWFVYEDIGGDNYTEFFTSAHTQKEAVYETIKRVAAES